MRISDWSSDVCSSDLRAGKSALWGAKPICRAHGKELHMKNLVETAKFKRISVAGRRLAKAKSGVALIEFAYSLPILMAMMMSGAELTNYATVKMRLSQVALHIADNGGRIGTGPVLSVKKISETDINDILTGAGLQAGSVDLYANGRIVLFRLEPMKDYGGKDRKSVVLGKNV